MVSGSIIGQHLPLGVPGFIPVSVSISPDRSATKNITELAPTLLTSDGVMIYGVKKNEHIPAEAVGDIIIQY